MSTKNKTRQKEKRAKDKRSRKAAHKAQYATWRDAGTNAKSFRATKRMSNKLVGTVSHPDGSCGNIGCMKCSSLYQEGGVLHYQQVEHKYNQFVTTGLPSVFSL